jgi:putative solute:sodium symporter small subunit
MHALSTIDLRRKVRRLTLTCLLAWVGLTLAPTFLARSGWHIGPWPIDFWMAAQGCVLGYVAIVVIFAWLVNHWERQADQLSFDLPKGQDS